MEFDIDRVRELVALAKEAQITELTVTNGNGRITIKKHLPGVSGGVPSTLSALGSSAAAALDQQPSYSPQDSGAKSSSSSALRFVPVEAPVVGTVYLGDRPEGEPLVRAGQRVKEGQLLCVVETMKILNEVTAPADGIIAQIVAENGQPVEYGQELMILELETP